MIWLAAASLAVWVGLLLFRGGFWRADRRLGPSGTLAAWPSVVAVIPARDEADTIGRTIDSLLAQDYPGAFRIVVVDDGSTDGTAALAARPERVTVLSGAPLPAGWVGKMWAVHQGLAAAGEAAYVLLTDADIGHDPASLRRLVWKAEREGRHLVSLMVRLRCASRWERLLIPAFVFFFQKLYPFPWVGDPARPEAAAAGGCMLVRRDALMAVGGVAAIRDRLIDDCALAANLKAGGPVWLGLTGDVHSLRAYDSLGEIWRMVTRSAYEQLGRRPWMVAVSVVAMGLTYVVPPLAVAWGAAAGDRAAAGFGLAAWLAMAVAYRPTLRLYGLGAWRGVWLPVAALLYTVMTVDSARRDWQGAGGAWKGRSYGRPGE